MIISCWVCLNRRMMHVAVDAAEVLLRVMKRRRISQLFDVVLFGVVALAFFVDSHEDDQLQVEIVSKPENCEQSLTSQKGNVLKMHYTGWLLDGTKFDSRLIQFHVEFLFVFQLFEGCHINLLKLSQMNCDFIHSFYKQFTRSLNNFSHSTHSIAHISLGNYNSYFTFLQNWIWNVSKHYFSNLKVWMLHLLHHPMVPGLIMSWSLNSWLSNQLLSDQQRYNL